MLKPLKIMYKIQIEVTTFYSKMKKLKVKGIKAKEYKRIMIR
jgi:hypothetical protein